VGFSDAPGTAELRMPVKRSGSLGFGLAHLGHGAGTGHERVESVRLVTIDGFCACLGLTRLDFIKAESRAGNCAC
jgi:hypothetical protein